LAISSCNISLLKCSAQHSHNLPRKKGGEGGGGKRKRAQDGHVVLECFRNTSTGCYFQRMAKGGQKRGEGERRGRKGNGRLAFWQPDPEFSSLNQVFPGPGSQKRKKRGGKEVGGTSSSSRDLGMAKVFVWVRVCGRLTSGGEKEEREKRSSPRRSPLLTSPINDQPT